MTKSLCVLTNIDAPIERQLIPNFPDWDGFDFFINQAQEAYDYLVCIGNMPFDVAIKCDPKNTIFIGYEPPEILRYPRKFLRQFQWVLSVDEDCNHPGLINTHLGFPWLVGYKPLWIKSKDGREDETLDFKQLQQLYKKDKYKTLSAMASASGWTQGHKDRNHFAHALKKHFGDKIDLYGRGTNEIIDKKQAFENYRFSVVVENSQHRNYFSEKIMDCFLCGTFPFYAGCPNIDEFFPENSFRRIDPSDLEKSIHIIEESIANEIDIKYQKVLAEARHLTLFKYNIFQHIINIINKIEKDNQTAKHKPRHLAYRRIIPFSGERFQNSPLDRVEYMSKIRAFKEDTKKFFRYLMINMPFASFGIKIKNFKKSRKHEND
jgi:hypothetical protein